MIYRYSRNHYPAAPTMDVTFVSAAENLRTGLTPAFVDSSADGTLVPVPYLDAIRAPTTTEIYVRSQWGERRRMLLYLVDVEIGDVTLPGIEVVGDEISDEIILWGAMCSIACG